MIKFPPEYQQKLEPIRAVYEGVEKTHKGLGKLALMEILADCSNRTLLVVASSGTGKSAIMNWMRDNVSREKLYLDAVTIPGLKWIQKELRHTVKTILIDDLSKGGTAYSQAMSVCCLGELVYSGFVRKVSAAINIDISGFRGSAIINAQPLILARVISVPEFETDIRDKVIRYYHLARPINVNLRPPTNGTRYEYHYARSDISSEVYMGKLYNETITNFRHEFSLSRSKEHLTALLQASALVNKRAIADNADLWLINTLSKNFRTEKHLFTKMDLEGESLLDPNIIPLLSIISTFKTYKFKDAMMDFKVKQRRLYEIIQNNKDLVSTVKGKGNSIIVPTKACRKLLKEIGEW